MRALLLSLTALVSPSAFAQSFTSVDYARTEHTVIARDGTPLYLVVYSPIGATKPLPILLTRTPYDASGRNVIDPSLAEFVRDGYIIAASDIRGRNKSGGTFLMTRPMRDPKDPKAIDEATDAYDTVDWMVKNVPNNNGRVGMFGVSYDGWTAQIAGLDPHPALKAVSPQASPHDMWKNDDFHRNGAFRLSYGFEYAFSMESGPDWPGFPFGEHDVYDWYRNLGPLSNVDQTYFKGKIPSWTEFVAHPNHDAYYKDRSAAAWMDAPKIPTLIVAGWWDQEDPVGPQTAYSLLTRNDPNRLVRLAIGPWNHGGWTGTGASLGVIQFGSDTGTYFRQKIQFPFFARHLKEEAAPEIARCTMFQTGSNAWKSYDQWPPAGGTKQKIYFGESGRLSFEAPKASDAFDSYVSDPDKPVPYRARPIEATYSRESRWWNWQIGDQRFVDGRPDVLTWQTAPLEKDLTVSGNVMAHLFAATSGTDSDWIVKLIDVLPEEIQATPTLGGYQLMLNAEVVRARFRESETAPKAVRVNRPLPYDIDLHWQDHTFKKGHRIMVQVQSTWFPLIDRNPQTFVPNIFLAEASAYRKATQKIYRSRAMPSSIEFTVN
ncbi:CocE/NonD family hydrolase [bacterium]|nr:MAG: CocE/NonD family hydrolase [bacterium]